MHRRFSKHKTCKNLQCHENATGNGNNLSEYNNMVQYAGPIVGYLQVNYHNQEQYYTLVLVMPASYSQWLKSQSK